MRHVAKLLIVAAGLAAAAPAWAQSPAMSYSFGPAAGAGSAAEAAAQPSRAPGADAIRWLGGLGPIPSEPGSAGAAPSRRK